MTRTLEDKIAIEELIARYNQAIDAGRYEEWLACWADDAIFDGLGRYLTGIDAIRGFANGFEVEYRQRLNALKHFTINIWSVVDGDVATSTSYLQLTTTSEQGVRVILTGRYEDELKRVDGRWRFARRKLHRDMPAPAPAPATPSAAPATDR